MNYISARNKLLPFLLLTLFYSGCSSSYVRYAPFDDVTYVRIDHKVNGAEINSKEDIMIDYDKLSKVAISQIFKKTVVPTQLIVTDFVNLESLKNGAKMGFVLSNSLKNALIQQYDTKIVEVEASKYLQISQDGLKLLSRDIETIKYEKLTIKRAVVGSFTYTQNELIVFVKLINLDSGAIEGSFSRALPMGKSTKDLLESKALN